MHNESDWTRTFWGVVAATVAAFVCMSAPKFAHAASCNERVVQKLVKLVNEARTSEGLDALECDPKLTRVAEAHSRNQCEMARMSHRGSDGSKFVDRYQRAGVEFGAGGENVARGARTAKKVHNGWMHSRGHRRNIMNPNFTRIGVGHVPCSRRSGSRRGPYWTQNFAGPSGGQSRSNYEVNTRSRSDRASAQSCPAQSGGPVTPGFGRRLGRSTVRILSETGGWILGAGLGTLIGRAAGDEYADNHPDANRQGWVLFSGAVGTMLGGSFGTFAGGDLQSGRGTIISTFLGGLAGTTSGAIVAAPYDGSLREVGIFAGSGLLGSILGYEISHIVERNNPNPFSLKIPTLSVDPEQGTPVVSISGRF